MRVVLIVVLAFFGTSVGLGRALARQETPALDRTDLRYVVPFSPDGLSAALTVAATETGTCISESLADAGRSDAWRCTVGNAIHDPCFASPFGVEGEPVTLACLDTPLAADVLLLTVDAPLPPRAGDAGGSDQPAPLPWVLELANGEQCDVATGATIGLVDMRLNYFCTGQGTILGEPDRGRPVWTVVYWPEGAPVTETVEVAVAWS
jgi:hypothetical protein